MSNHERVSAVSARRLLDGGSGSGKTTLAHALAEQFDEGAVELSGGQWQRVALARAFYKQNSMLVLDEPTAALDGISERIVSSSLDKLGRERGLLLVTHRMSMAMQADEILVLKDGRIIERGTHFMLMAIEGGRYSRMFRDQADGYAS